MLNLLEAPGFLLTSLCMAFKFADFALNPFPVIHLSCESDLMPSCINPASESLKLGIISGSPDTRYEIHLFNPLFPRTSKQTESRTNIIIFILPLTLCRLSKVSNGGWIFVRIDLFLAGAGSPAY